MILVKYPAHLRFLAIMALLFSLVATIVSGASFKGPVFYYSMLIFAPAFIAYLIVVIPKFEIELNENGIISRKPRIKILQVQLSDTVELKWEDVDQVYFVYGHMFIDNCGISYKKNGKPGAIYITSGLENYREALIFIHEHVPFTIVDKKISKLVEKYKKEARFKYFRNG
jgi:hypothetical protein